MIESVSQTTYEWISMWVTHSIHIIYNFPSLFSCTCFASAYRLSLPSSPVAQTASWLISTPIYSIPISHLLSTHTVPFSLLYTPSSFSPSCHSLHTVGQEYFEGSEYLSNMPAEAERTDELEYEVGHHPVSSCHFYYSHLISNQHDCL